MVAQLASKVCVCVYQSIQCLPPQQLGGPRHAATGRLRPCVGVSVDGGGVAGWGSGGVAVAVAVGAGVSDRGVGGGRWVVGGAGRWGDGGAWVGEWVDGCCYSPPGWAVGLVAAAEWGRRGMGGTQAQAQGR